MGKGILATMLSSFSMPEDFNMDGDIDDYLKEQYKKIYTEAKNTLEQLLAKKDKITPDIESSYYEWVGVLEDKIKICLIFYPEFEEVI